MGEFSPLNPFLGIGFDDLNAGNRFGQSGIHHPKLPAQSNTDRPQLVNIITKRDGEADQEKGRHQQQLYPQQSNQHIGRYDGRKGIDNQHQTRTEHKVQRPYIVSSPGHDITHPLAGVKGLTFAQQAHIQFVTGIPLNALGQEFGREVAQKCQNVLPGGGGKGSQGQPKQLAILPAGGKNQVKGPTDKDLHVTVKRVID